MIVIQCPYCREERTEEELTFGGEAEIVRPLKPEEVSDKVWTEYLYFRSNPKGIAQEQWCCSGGCGQWFKVARHTVSHEILQVLRYDGVFHENLNAEHNSVSTLSQVPPTLDGDSNEENLNIGGAR